MERLVISGLASVSPVRFFPCCCRRLYRLRRPIFSVKVISFFWFGTGVGEWPWRRGSGGRRRTGGGGLSVWMGVGSRAVCCPQILQQFPVGRFVPEQPDRCPEGGEWIRLEVAAYGDVAFPFVVLCSGGTAELLTLTGRSGIFSGIRANAGAARRPLCRAPRGVSRGPGRLGRREWASGSQREFRPRARPTDLLRPIFR